MSRLALLTALAILTAGCQVASQTAGAPTGTFTLAAFTGSAPPSVSPEPVPSPAESASSAPVPTPTPPLTHRRRGGSGGGGAPALTPAELGLDTGYAAVRVAGAAEGSGALGTDALSARFMGISGITLAPDGTLYVADPVRHEIREIPVSGPTRVLAGIGAAAYMGENVPADASALNTPMGLLREPLTGALLVADAGNDRIRLFTPGGRIHTLAGGGTAAGEAVGNPLSARLSRPTGLAADGTGRVYFTERGSGRVRHVAATGGVATLATLTVDAVGAIAVRWDGLRVWAAEAGSIRLMRPGTVPALDPTPVATFADATVTGLAYDQAGGLYALLSAPGTGGRRGTRLYRLPVGDDGLMPADRAPEPVAGTGEESADANAYSAPAVEVPDAATVLLGGAWMTALAIDLTHAADPTRLAGQLYLGSSLDDAGTRFGQVLRLTPRE